MAVLCVVIQKNLPGDNWNKERMSPMRRERVEQAADRKNNGSNCCQAVLLNYADEIGLPEEILAKLAAGFGAGGGTRQGVCGALNGAVMALDLLNDGTTRPMKEAKEAQIAFREKTGAILCKDIKGVETGVELCSCSDCVRNAATVVEEALDRRAKA